MPRMYTRRPGSRKYVDYSPKKLQQCLSAINEGRMSQREASKHFEICRNTIQNKLKLKHNQNPGHPTIFTASEESAFVAHIVAVSEFGFPLDELDFRFIVKDYLTSQNKTIPQFRNNFPGLEWSKIFLKRHPMLTLRLAANIKRYRAAINEKTLSEYIENLAQVVTNVPAENIYNYDETNLSDDPGRKKIICRRGCKYPERVINSSKSNISVMFCGNAAGGTIPPYVVYKSEHLWSTWTENGPHGTRYSRTKHGWLDNATFEEWFTAHLLPILKKQTGKKVLIGDNLSSHISQNVLKLCKENNIVFVCLPPNSSHLTQPLDVAYFRPLKNKWKIVLTLWKESPVGKKSTTLPKGHFPSLLKKVLELIKDTSSENLISGFAKCGIFPCDKEPLINRLPLQDRSSADLSLISKAFISHLNDNRADLGPSMLKRKKKLNVPPGKGICPDSEESDVIPVKNTVKVSQKRKKVKCVISSATSNSEYRCKLRAFKSD
ncbi:uncharacterized protein LOC124810243 [Hydra vulgaris]|uniref:uncharacterized protein LOC124810243 n=1 Tax=Hydra vulgaris TaxID=6087 RepID=UPI001F5EF519|nr:uncharacterized protein LOC124810243 [Hydra vulgaris]